MKKQFLRFLVAGGLAAVANFGSRFIFSAFFSYTVAIVFAYLIGMLVAFLLMRAHVFDAKEGNVVTQISLFVGVNLFAMLQTIGVSLILVRWVLPSLGSFEYNEAIAHLVGVLVPAVTSYFGHKFLTFR